MMKTRDIYLVDLNPAKGAEMKKARPCIIVSSEDIGILPLKIVVPLIGYKNIHANKSWLVGIEPSSENGLSKKSTADALNIRSISDQRIIKKLGTLEDHLYLELLQAMKTVLNIQ